MKTPTVIASSLALAFALAFSAAPALAHGHDADSMEITHQGMDKACCKKKGDDPCHKDPAMADSALSCDKHWKCEHGKCDKHGEWRKKCDRDSADCVKGAKCEKHGDGQCCRKKSDDHCRKDSVAADTSSPVAKQAIKPSKAKK